MSWHDDALTPPDGGDNSRARAWYDQEVEFGHPVVSETTVQLIEAEFSPLIVERYEGFKEKFLKWMKLVGKNYQKREGYADATVRTTHYKIEDIFRWKWKREGEFSITFDTEEAYTYLASRLAATTDSDRTYTDYEKAVKRFHDYERTVNGKDYSSLEDYIEANGKKELDFDRNDTSKSDKDKLHKEELRRLYNAALTVYSVRSYHNKRMSSEERDRIKTMLAERHHKPKASIGPEDFRKANSWKIPSLMAVAVNLGLRPIEVKRANINWIDLDNKKMIFPPKDAAKSDEPWVCDLSSEAVTALEKWIDERAAYEKYDDSPALWLNERGNRYSVQSLNGILEDLLEEAEINEGVRDLSFYSIRHGAATYWANETNLEKAAKQLRHSRLETTKRYIRDSSHPTDDISPIG
ncbi:tyrosine-type recombinase/integrase [Halomicrobium urmianum]|uniref:tyrosine-type recombinase/integrase n=1 Tax=Halomicrobium urmianum TaxID=1586233 RepID=UPI001CD9BF6B|nr:site-specific integrase [Halomicrobium urmianum]